MILSPFTLVKETIKLEIILLLHEGKVKQFFKEILTRFINLFINKNRFKSEC